MKKVKVRASLSGLIMTDPRGKSNLDKYNDAKESLEKKVTRLAGLSEKAIKSREKLEPEIEALEINIKALALVKDEVLLSESAKSLAVRMYWEIEHGIKKDLTSKYFDKGNDAEPESIALAQDVNGWDVIEKNSEQFENDYLTGTPDLVYKDLIPDIKTSWTAHTYPLFETDLSESLYYWQVQSYLALTGRPLGVVSFCLTDTPEILVQDELYKYARINGLIECPGDVELNIRHAHNYSRLPKKMRVKNFYIERDEDAIQNLYDRVDAFNVYYNSLFEIDELQNL